MIEQIKPITVPLARAHELLGSGTRTQFKKVFVDTGLIQPVDMGGRGLSVIVSELEAAVLKRAEAIRTGSLVPPIRNSRGRRASQPQQRTVAA
jgi:hypothetical protein